jgi:ABC-type multidrug transport system ATPase subunit
MRQRLGLAQALLGRPEVLILDEPTNGLDPAGIQEIRELLRRLPRERGVGVFLSSHLLNEVEQVADRIGIIQRGRLRFQGTLEELRNRMRSRLILGVNRVEEALRKVQALGYSASPLGERGLAVATTDEDHAARINTALTTAGFKVWRLSVEHPSLEDIFLELTSGEETGGS